ncbi:ketosynthase chain-length factor [Micromonospora halophytica]|uniref:Act minimal PKS chain-length factor (CLF/KS beta) n=1 Tax=Micromonospora halophytica TaxID=47864 RepID=A0A1C5IJG0_9ACTN|nr:ketosynthase chain-length factor [Micromonospora halophytica]SCG58528.1 act minimal PKS chain-length factor (CLF/KS beta) [Micromonospora halophytica]
MSAVVVTGMGVVAPTGLGARRHWENTLAGRTAIGRITAFDPAGYSSRLAGEIRDFVPGEHLPGRLLPQTDHMTRLSLVAADWALEEAAVDQAALPEFGMGVVTASSAGGFEFGHRELEKLWSRGPEHVSAYQSFAWFYAVNTGQIAIRHGMRGPNGVLVTEQAGGLDAVAQARRQVRGGTPVMVSGAVDGSPCPWGWVAQLSGGGISRSEDPDRAFLPFDVQAAGYVPGDGGALFVLETEQGARARGVRSRYGEIAGYAATFDPPPRSERPSTLRRAIELALEDAGLEPSRIDVVFADGAGVPERDRVEAEALLSVFGPYGVSVTVPKTMTGRLSAGGAALDLATALLTLRHGEIPPTVNVTSPVPDYQLDLVTQPRRRPVSAALVVARGHGGFNAAMVVTR